MKKKMNKKKAVYASLICVALILMICVIMIFLSHKKTEKVSENGRTYMAFCQYANDYKGYNSYLTWHGCAACSMTTILRAFSEECQSWTPYESITIAEKNTAGNAVFNANYDKALKKQMPVSLQGISWVLDEYDIEHEYITAFPSDEFAKADILSNLRNDKPVIFIVGQYNRHTNDKSSKWTRSYHTMVMIGCDDNNNVMIADPANGDERFKKASIDEMLGYMWSCTAEPDSFYWNGKEKCGGYIKVN